MGAIIRPQKPFRRMLPGYQTWSTWSLDIIPHVRKPQPSLLALTRQHVPVGDLTAFKKLKLVVLVSAFMSSDKTLFSSKAPIIVSRTRNLYETILSKALQLASDTSIVLDLFKTYGHLLNGVPVPPEVAPYLSINRLYTPLLAILSEKFVHYLV